MLYRVDRKIVLLVIIAWMLAACSSGPKKSVSVFSADSETALKQVLYRHYQEWKSIPYRLGGLSKSGIDCSGFVFLTFEQKLGIHLPRSSERQAEIGRPVPRQLLKTGDLVFFKTGPTQNHVGIYIGQGKFLHVSALKGVAISDMDNVYWSGKYWKSVRVLSS